MGNCLQSNGDGGGGGYAASGEGLVQLQGRRRRRGGDEEEEEGTASVMKVKMVLTKAELEWLMAQLKSGDRRLEDVLREMARKRNGRGGAGGWRQSLESIVECPETTAGAAVGSD